MNPMTIGPDGQPIREPLPEFDREYFQPDRFYPVSKDGLYHYFMPGDVPMCGSRNGTVGSQYWHLTDCPDCREIGQRQQPLKVSRT